jgi:hypothetical protein
MSKNPKVKVKGQVADFNKTQKATVLKHSNFFLTINTNQSYKVDDAHIDNDTEVLVEVIENILNNINSYVKLPAGATFDNNVKNADIDYVVEKGNSKHMLHCHIYLKFTHDTDVKLDFAAIKKQVCDRLGLPNIHMMNRMVRSNDDNVLNYLGKYGKK